MAKQSMKARDVKRVKLAEKFFAKRAESFLMSMPLTKIVGMQC